MERREFIILLGGAAAAWPLAARAQQDRAKRVGVLRDTRPSDPDAQSDFAAFENAFQKLGWNLARKVDYHWSGGDPERSRALAPLHHLTRTRQHGPSIATAEVQELVDWLLH